MQEKNIEGAPDLIIEILSSNVERDTKVKKKTYEQNNVKEYWIVDPVAETVTVFILNPEATSFKDEKLYSGIDLLESTVMKGFSCKVKDFFA